MKFRLLGENSKVEIDVLDREYPNSSDYSDGKLVISNVKAEIPEDIMLILLQVYSTTSYWITSFS